MTHLPEPYHISELEFPFEGDQYPSEAEKEVERASTIWHVSISSNDCGFFIHDLPRWACSSGSITPMSCCNVDSCFFIPLWSRRKLPSYERNPVSSARN